MNIGDQVADLKDIKAEIKDMQTELKALEHDKRIMEDRIMTTLDESGSSLARTDFGTVSVTKEVVANVTDWDAFYNYIKERDAFYLLQRRVSSVAWRDEVTAHYDGVVPGTEPFTKRKISFTNKTT